MSQFLCVLAEALIMTWHGYVVSAIRHVFLLSFILALFEICCFYSSTNTLNKFLVYISR